MGRPRAFDHDRARELRAQGWTYRRIAEELGVSHNAVMRACDPAYRARQKALIDKRIEAKRAECLGGCGVRVWLHAAGRSGYCTACAARLRVKEDIRPDTLRCRRCGEWKPDAEFSKAPGVAKARRGKRSECVTCESARRRELRAADPERERAYQRDYYRRKRAAA